MSLYDGTSSSYHSLNPQQSLGYIIQNFICYMNSQNIARTEMIGSTTSVRSFPRKSSSIESYLNYRKNIHNKLAEINTNVSQMIIDGCRDIDTICLKVRQCIDETESRTRSIPMLVQYEKKQHSIEPAESLNECPLESLDSVETTSENEDSPKQSENEDSPKQSENEDSPKQSENEDSPKQSENEDSPKQSENEDSPKQSENEDSPKQLETENKLLAAKLARKIGKRNSLLDEFRDILIEKINNNFDIMERIVENTNEEIESLNTNTTGTNNEEHNESSQETHENKLEHKSKRTEIDIKTAEEKPYVTPISSEMTETRCKQVENVSEDNFDLPTLKEIPLSEISLIPEVYIKPGVTDINKKLITQLEANDSFICFQKLMRKNRKKVKKFSKTRSKQEISNSVPKISSTFSHETITSNQSCRTPKRGQKRITKPSEVDVSNASISKKSISRNYFSKSLATMKTDGESFKLKRVFMKSDLRTKYSDSLWFSDRYVMKKSLVDKTETSPREKVKRKKITKKSSQKHVENKRPKSHQNKKVTINNSSATLLNFKRTRSLNKCTIGYPCSVTINNDLPSSFDRGYEYRLRWMRARAEQASTRKLQFLDILDDLTPRDLLPLHSEYPRKDECIVDEDELKYFRNRKVEDTYLYKLMYGNQNKNRVWNQLLQPGIECSDKNCTKCHQKCQGNKSTEQDSIDDSKINPKEIILERLAPYLQAPKNEKRYYQFTTVMPVRVFYDRDNHKTNETVPYQNIPKPNSLSIQKIALVPREMDRARWCPPGCSKRKQK